MPNTPSDWKSWVLQKLQVDKRLLLVYIIVYFIWGLGMNEIGKYLEIARFTYWWQVITVYLIYMIPISLLLREMPFHRQYAYGLIAMGVLEFSGYVLQSSYAYPNNMLDQAFGIRNFTLGMALFFALYFPAGNWLVGKIYNGVFRSNVVS